MKVDKSKLLNALKQDLKASTVLRDSWMAKIYQWRREYNGEKYGNEQKGKSQIVSKDIKKQAEWLHPSILDPFVSTQDIVKVTPVTWEDEAAAKQSELLLNYQFCRQFDRYNFMSKALKVAIQDGTVIVQTGWEYQDEEVEVEREVIATDEYGNQFIAKAKVTETKVIKNRPTAVVCRNEDIYLDPTCKDDLDKCQFIIHRYETDYSTLKQDGRYKNLEKAMESSGAEVSADYDYINPDKTLFRFEDQARKKLMVYEYWGNYDVNGDGVAEPIVCAWIGNVIIRLQSNPYPDKKPPFLIVPFNSSPFVMHGESDAELISDNQKIKTAVTRGLIDNMAQSNNGQVGVRKGALDAVNRKKWMEGKHFEFNGTPNDFWFGNYNPIPGSAFDMLSVMNNEIESLTAVKSFSGGLTGNSLGTTATGARGVLDATAMRRLNRVRNVAENLVKPLMRKWLAYSNEFLDESQIVRVTNDDYVEIRRDDLAGNVDLEINISTAEDNQTKAGELSFLLQTLGVNMDPQMRNMLMAEIARLHKMPALEKSLREWQPQPDPMAEQLKALELQRLQLENMKLQADIEDKLARARENGIDAQVKQAKMQTELAKARKLGSDADMKDLEFLMKNEGIDREDQARDREEKRLHELDKIALGNMMKEKGE